MNIEKMLDDVCEHCDIRVNAKSQEECDEQCQECWFAEYAHELLKEEDDLK